MSTYIYQKVLHSIDIQGLIFLGYVFKTTTLILR